MMTKAASSVEADPAFEGQIQARILAQLARPIRMLFFIRFLGLTAVGLAGLAVARSYNVEWDWVAAGALALSGFLVVMFRREIQRELPVTADGLRLTFLSVVILQSLVIGLTGGLRGPLVVAFIPIMILSAVVSGQRSVVWPAMAYCTAAMTFFWGVDAFDPEVLPAMSANIGGPLLAVTVVLACFMGATVGLIIRRAFDASIRGEAVARAGAIDMLRARNRELKELGSSLAHELKNPLSAIQGLTIQQLRNADEGSQEAERLTVVVSEVKRMSRVLDDFLTFSRPFADVEITDADLADALRKVITLYRDHLDGMGIAVTQVGATSLRAPVDTRQLDHVLVNLLLNAIDASERGSTIEFELHEQDDSAIVEVRDQGVGLQPGTLERAFEAGFTTRDDGTGLGLTISRGIINAHGGHLSLENRPQGGCIARIALPRGNS